jgi:uncharacterized protein (DUF2147 family)
MRDKAGIVKTMAAAALVAAFCAPLPSFGYGVDDVSGLWSGDEGTLIRLRPCGGALCGDIVRPPQDGSELQLVAGFRRISANRWNGGRVYDAGDGATYDVELEMLDAANIKVRACWLAFCDTLLWRRVE